MESPDISDMGSLASIPMDDENLDENAPVEPNIVGAARAVVRFRAGTVAWSENMYRVQTGRRQSDEDYRLYQRTNWEQKKAEYNTQRRQRRKEARERMEAWRSENGRPPSRLFLLKSPTI